MDQPYKVETASDTTKKITFKEGYITVIIPQKNGKNTICVSCQVGCPVGCVFCYTGKFKRNLSASEIIHQVNVSMEIIGGKPTSIVYMGMGEPMLNFNAVSESIETMHRELRLGYRRFTVSTSGHHLDKLINVPYRVALSLHTPFDDVRKKLIPGSKSIATLLEFVEKHCAVRKEGIMIEYTLIEGVTDRDEDLMKLLSIKWPENINFNFIQYNELGEFKQSDRLTMFKQAMIGAGYKSFVRLSRGPDIDAACGMLDYA